MQLHHWEEPPISGTSGSGTVFFGGCNLGCVYCQNHAISSKKRVGKQGTAPGEPSIGALVSTFLGLQHQGAMNINLVTPTHYAPVIRSALKRAREEGFELPIVWNTSGYEEVGEIAANEGFVDVYLTDMKYADAALGRALSGVADYPEVAIRAIDEMVATTAPIAYDSFHGEERMTAGVIVRHMLLPGHLDDSMDVVGMLHERYGDRVRLSLMNQYTPVLATRAAAGERGAQEALAAFPELGRAVLREEYEELLDFADGLGVEDYFWQDGEACKESFIPDFAGTG